jgi:hypothetical protein
VQRRRIELSCRAGLVVAIADAMKELRAMKLPNLRLSETQANLALVFSLLGVISLPVLAFLVFKNFDFTDKSIRYNPDVGLGQYRGPLIYVGTGLASGACILAGLLGFNSLGHKRNNKQTYSWLGMLLGAVTFALLIVMFFAWRQLSEPLILK